MIGRRIPLKGFTIAKGRVVRDEKRYDVATQIKRRRGSKRVRVARKGALR